MIERDDDRAFDELRARVKPGRLKRKAMMAGSALSLMLFAGCSYYWLALPTNSLRANRKRPTVSLPAAIPRATPTELARAAQPVPSATMVEAVKPTPVAFKATPTATATPRPVTAQATPQPKPRPQPKPTPALVASVAPAEKLTKAKIVRVFRPNPNLEKERRKRAILNSLSQ